MYRKSGCVAFALGIGLNCCAVQLAVAGEGDSSAVTLRFGGDCLLAGHYEHSVGQDISRAFEGFDLLWTADIAMVNLECPVTVRGKKVEKPFNFRMHPKFLQVLKVAGIDVVNIANNHIFDYDSIGLYDTIHLLDSAGIGHVGAGRNKEEAHQPVVAIFGSTRVAFFGYYGGGEAPVATESGPGVARRTVNAIRADIQELRLGDSLACVVVNVHWGTEKAIVPDLWQVDMAHEIIDAGANVVVGHHPHVLQAVEIYKNGIIAYSLGNLIFGGNARSSYDTALLEIQIRGGGIEHRVVPVRVMDWTAQELLGDEADRLMNYVKDLPLLRVDETRHEAER